MKDMGIEKTFLWNYNWILIAYFVTLNTLSSLRVCFENPGMLFLSLWGHLWGLGCLYFFCLCDIQMLLPEGIHRDNCKMYEEVEIPPNEPMPIGFEEKPVYISELDEVGATVDLCLFLCAFVHSVWICACVCTLGLDYWAALKTDCDISHVRMGQPTQWTHPYWLCWQTLFGKCCVIATVTIYKCSLSLHKTLF